jgi:uncharacterized protein
MIQIRPYGKYLNGFSVEGHAGFGESGQDIVCSSVSVITQMVAFEIDHFAYGDYRVEDGKLQVFVDRMKLNLEEEEYVKRIMEMMSRTLIALQMMYPNNIKVESEFE